MIDWFAFHLLLIFFFFFIFLFCRRIILAFSWCTIINQLKYWQGISCSSQSGVDRELSHQLEQIQTHQGCSEGTSSVAFEALLINGQIDLINFLIFNCLTLNINLLIFNCLTSNFCFRKNISDFKLTWENDDLLSSSYK